LFPACNIPETQDELSVHQIDFQLNDVSLSWQNRAVEVRVAEKDKSDLQIIHLFQLAKKCALGGKMFPASNKNAFFWIPDAQLQSELVKYPFFSFFFRVVTIR